MRMKRFQIWFEPSMKDCVLNLPVQCEEVRMPFSHTSPDDRWLAADMENTDPVYRQKKRRYSHLLQCLAQLVLCWRIHVTEETKR